MGCSFSKCREDISCAVPTSNITNFANEFEIDLTNFKVSSYPLGIGGFGVVRSAIKIGGEDNGKMYAMKTMNKCVIMKRNSGPSCVLSELQALIVLSDCNFVCRLHYAFQDNSYLYMVLDIAEGGDMRYNLRLQPNARFTEHTAKLYFCQILLALDYCHMASILHRDVKPENILMSKAGYLKLTDFGVAKLLPNIEDCRSTSGTHGYMAPEIYASDHIHGTPAEWFAAGITLHEFLTGRRPFEVHKLQSYKSHKLPDPLRTEYLEESCDFLSQECKDFIRKLLAVKTIDRLGTIDGLIEIMQHPWLTQINWNDLKQCKLPAPCIPDLSHRAEVNADEMKRVVQQNLVATPLNKQEQEIFKRYKYNNQLNRNQAPITHTVTSEPCIKKISSGSSKLDEPLGYHDSRPCKHKVTQDDSKNSLTESYATDIDGNDAALRQIRKGSPPRKRRSWRVDT